MPPLMINSISICSESPSTMLTNVGALSCMSSDMVAKTCTLREFALAIWVWACIWLDPQMYIPMSR